MDNGLYVIPEKVVFRRFGKQLLELQGGNDPNNPPKMRLSLLLRNGGRRPETVTLQAGQAACFQVVAGPVGQSFVVKPGRAVNFLIELSMPVTGGWSRKVRIQDLLLFRTSTEALPVPLMALRDDESAPFDVNALEPSQRAMLLGEGEDEVGEWEEDELDAADAGEFGMTYMSDFLGPPSTRRTMFSSRSKASSRLTTPAGSAMHTPVGTDRNGRTSAFGRMMADANGNPAPDRASGPARESAVLAGVGRPPPRWMDDLAKDIAQKYPFQPKLHPFRADLYGQQRSKNASKTADGAAAGGGGDDDDAPVGTTKARNLVAQDSLPGSQRIKKLVSRVQSQPRVRKHAPEPTRPSFRHTMAAMNPLATLAKDLRFDSDPMLLGEAAEEKSEAETQARNASSAAARASSSFRIGDIIPSVEDDDSPPVSPRNVPPPDLSAYDGDGVDLSDSDDELAGKKEIAERAAAIKSTIANRSLYDRTAALSLKRPDSMFIAGVIPSVVTRDTIHKPGTESDVLFWAPGGFFAKDGTFVPSAPPSFKAAVPTTLRKTAGSPLPAVGESPTQAATPAHEHGTPERATPSPAARSSASPGLKVKTKPSDLQPSSRSTRPRGTARSAMLTPAAASPLRSSRSSSRSPSRRVSSRRSRLERAESSDVIRPVPTPTTKVRRTDSSGSTSARSDDSGGKRVARLPSHMRQKALSRLQRLSAAAPVVEA